jgi:uncharacterized protein with NAD-binding domain and iron-sulfur cluster
MSKKKVAILGGGIAGLSAAFELTELDPTGDQFDITIYTIGWRLGGKGAVGRNQDKGNRAEEHGLHIWAGFYDNAFNLVDRCYEALKLQGDHRPFGSLSKAFKGLDHAVLMEPAPRTAASASWRSPWYVHLPPNDETPGTSGDSFLTLVDYLQSLVVSSAARLKTLLRHGFADDWPDGAPLWLTDTERSMSPLEITEGRINSLPADPRDISPDQSEKLQILLNAVLLVQLEKVEITNDDIRHTYILCDIALALAFGILKDEVIWWGFDCIDHQEWTDWMKANGCSHDSLGSALVRGCYDYVFGFVRGDRDVAAGTGTRLLLKFIFAYKGSFFYVLRATMGELVFAPIYQVLRHRGVNFEFFTRIDSIELSADRRSIESIQTTIQATADPATYEPLIWIGDGDGRSLASWPSKPKYDLLLEGKELEAAEVDLESAWSDWRNVGSRLLKCGDQFDLVVLGIGLGAFETICRDLTERIPAWKEMVNTVKTTATIAFQIWTTDPTRELGWNFERTILSGFAEPLDSWGDLSLMLPLEKWPADHSPKSLGYFVGSFQEDAPAPPPYTDACFPKNELERARTLTLDWVKNDLPVLWPKVRNRGNIDWDLFFDPHKGAGENRLKAQYLRVNINPSDRYVLSVKGSVFKRMKADESGVDNLYLAGDWVRTGINAGCIESAVMAGRAAASAITGVSIPMPNSSDFNDIDLPTALLPALELLRKASRRTIAGVGEIEAFCVLDSWPSDALTSLLPPGLQLYVPPPKTNSRLRAEDNAHAEETNEAPAKMHDVVFIFARQRNVRPGLLPFGGANYVEIAQLIPNVQHKDIAALKHIQFSFMPSLLLDSLPPVIVGQNLYGFNKQLASIRADGDSFSVRSSIGSMNAWFERTGLPGGISEYPSIAKIQHLLERPLIGVKADGSFIYSILNFGLNGAAFQPVRGKIRRSPPFLPAIPELDVNPVSTNPAFPKFPWGFHFISRWSLTLPFGFPTGPSSASGQNLRRVAAEYTDAILGGLPFRRP